MTTHDNQTIRHPLVFRTVQVLDVEQLTPHMQRITVGGEALNGFHSGAPDDHAKLFFPNADGELAMPTPGPNGPEPPAGKPPSPGRDYTPRLHDAKANTLVIDFVLHGEGPATAWAAQARVGQTLGLGGPRGSFLVAGDYARYVLIGDETALPAIARWLEEMPAGRRVEVLIEIPEEGDRQALVTLADANITWLARNGVPAATSTLLEDALAALELDDDSFYWIAAESVRTRNMRLYLDGKGIAKDEIRAKGYWKHDSSQSSRS